MLEQTTMFPLFCAESGHDFEMAQDGYYKQDEKGEPVKTKVFRMIFCIKCGDNREIMVVDRTPQQNGNIVKSKSKTKSTKRR